MKLAGHFEIESRLMPGARVREKRPARALPCREGHVDSLDLSWDGEAATLFGFLVVWDQPVGGADSFAPDEVGLLEVLDA